MCPQWCRRVGITLHRVAPVSPPSGAQQRAHRERPAAARTTEGIPIPRGRCRLQWVAPRVAEALPAARSMIAGRHILIGAVCRCAMSLVFMLLDTACQFSCPRCEGGMLLHLSRSQPPFASRFWYGVFVSPVAAMRRWHATPLVSFATPLRFTVSVWRLCEPCRDGALRQAISVNGRRRGIAVTRH
jgi:hypothetical protein